MKAFTIKKRVRRKERAAMMPGSASCELLVEREKAEEERVWEVRRESGRDEESGRVAENKRVGERKQVSARDRTETKG